MASIKELVEQIGTVSVRLGTSDVVARPLSSAHESLVRKACPTDGDPDEDWLKRFYKLVVFVACGLEADDGKTIDDLTRDQFIEAADQIVAEISELPWPRVRDAAEQIMTATGHGGDDDDKRTLLEGFARKIGIQMNTLDVPLEHRKEFMQAVERAIDDEADTPEEKARKN